MLTTGLGLSPAFLLDLETGENEMDNGNEKIEELPNLYDLQEKFEKFVQVQAAQSPEISFIQMMATPYGMHDGKLAAAFHMFQYAYNLGAKQNA